jgi:hypothetical protein
MKVTVDYKNRQPVVKWLEDDGYHRVHRHRTVRAAKVYAKQLACRLELDAYRRELARAVFLKDAASKKGGGR